MAGPDIIRVGAVAGVFAQVPGTAVHGAQVNYIGRRCDLDAMAKCAKQRSDGVVVLTDFEACYPIDETWNTTFGRAEGVSKMSALGSLMRSGEAVPLDEATAAWVGVPLKQKTAPAAPAPVADPAPVAIPAPPPMPQRTAQRSHHKDPKGEEG
jgi:hypothetical protein